MSEMDPQQDPAQPPRLRGEVVGFRAWRASNEMVLHALVTGGAWRPGVNVARCEPGLLGSPVDRQHASPHQDCHCGLYAYHDRALLEQGALSFAGRGPIGPVNGAIVASGRLEVHATGFRAERARIAVLELPGYPLGDHVVRGLARIYGAVAVAKADLVRVASEYGDPIPADLQPDAPSSSITWVRGASHIQTSVRNGRIYTVTTAGTDRGSLLSHILQMNNPPGDGYLSPGYQGLFQVQNTQDLPKLPGVAYRDAAASMRKFLEAFKGVKLEPWQAKLLEPVYSKGVPEAVRKARAARPNYDPTAFVPKRKGGKR